MQNSRNCLVLLLLWLVFGIVKLVDGQQHWPNLLSKAAVQLSARHVYSHIDSSDDSPTQREALLTFFSETGGSKWRYPGDSLYGVSTFAAWDWDRRNTSYCEWPGVLCCKTAQHVHDLLADLLPYAGGHDNLSCARDTDVAGLFLSAAGLTGSLPIVLGELPGLRTLILGHNPGLHGAWPRSLQLPQLLFLDVQETSLRVCIEGDQSSTISCELPPWLFFANVTVDDMPGQSGLSCPQLVLSSRRPGQQASQKELQMFDELMQFLGVPPQQSVAASPGFFNAAGCVCAAGGQHLHELNSSSASSNKTKRTWVCEAHAMDTGQRRMLTAGICFLVGVLLLMSIGYYVWRRAGWLHVASWLSHGQLSADSREAEAVAAAAGELTMVAKRSRFPGTPSIALAPGKGVLAVSEVLVTWVVTDIESSTQLWEWDSVVMGAAVEQHNVVLRSLLDEHGGHEVRTDGDSFTLAFHDAADAVAYCIQAQEQLLDVPWPRKLLDHPFCAPVTLGEVCAARNPDIAMTVRDSGALPLEQQGPLVMNGLRVRMGINTGVPDDIFVHDLTEHVEYRGEEYSLTEELADIAAGGQILMGPKTFQRWNRVFSQAAMPSGKEWKTSGDASLFDMPPNPPEPCMEGGLASQIQLQRRPPSIQHSSSVLKHGRWRLSELVSGAQGEEAHSTQVATRSSNSCLTSGGMDTCGFSDKPQNEGARQDSGSLVLLAPEQRMQPPLIPQHSEGVGSGTDQGQACFHHSPSTELLHLVSNKAQASAETDGLPQGARPAHGFGDASSMLPAQSSKHDPDSCPHSTTGQTHKMVRPRSHTIGGITFAINTAGLGTASAAAMKHGAAAGAFPAAFCARHSIAAVGGQSLCQRAENCGAGHKAATTWHATQDDHFAQHLSKGSGGPVAEGTEQQPEPLTGGAVYLSSATYSAAESFPAARSRSLPVLSTVQSMVSGVSECEQITESDSATLNDHQSQVAQHSKALHCHYAEPPDMHLKSAQAVGLPNPEEDTRIAARGSSMTLMFRRLGSVTARLMKGSSSSNERDSAGFSSEASSHPAARHSVMGTKAWHSSFWGANSKNARSIEAPQDSSTSTQMCNAVLIDLGYYCWRPDDSYTPSKTSGAGDTGVQAAGTEVPGSILHLVHVQSQRLAPRMLLFDWPLLACQGEDALLEQVLPGFMDAPGASSLSFTSMRVLMDQAGAPPPARADVAIAFVAPAGMKEVQSLGPEISQACQSLFTCVVREVLLAMGGYESKEVEGQVMAVFAEPRQAVEWALALQCALLHATWPLELTQLPSTASIQPDVPSGHQNMSVAPSNPSYPESCNSPRHSVRSSKAGHGLDSNFYSPDCLFKGIRARIGIWSGPIDRVLPHGKSGRADYLGPPANRAARLMGAAQGGQILVEEGIMQQVLQQWQQKLKESSAAALAYSSHHATSEFSGDPQSAQHQESSCLPLVNQPRFKRSESLPASPKQRVPSNLLLDSSRQRRRRSGKRSSRSQTGSVPDIEGLDYPSGGRGLNSSLRTSLKRGVPRSLLLQHMLDGAAYPHPGMSATCPPSTPSQCAAPHRWETKDDRAEAVGTAHSERPAWRPTCAIDVSSASECFDGPGQLRHKLAAVDAAHMLPQGLTVAPAAYQPRDLIARSPELRSLFWRTMQPTDDIDSIICSQELTVPTTSSLAGSSNWHKQRRRSDMDGQTGQLTLQELAAKKSGLTACYASLSKFVDDTVPPMSTLQRAHSCGTFIARQEAGKEHPSSTMVQPIGTTHGLTTAASDAEPHGAEARSAGPYCLSQSLPASAFPVVSAACAGNTGYSDIGGCSCNASPNAHAQDGQVSQILVGTHPSVATVAEALGPQRTDSSGVSQPEGRHHIVALGETDDWRSPDSATGNSMNENLSALRVAHTRQHPLRVGFSSDSHCEQAPAHGNGSVTARRKPILRVTVDSPADCSPAQSQGSTADSAQESTAWDPCFATSPSQLSCREQLRSAGLASPTNRVKRTLLRNVSFADDPTPQVSSRLSEGTWLQAAGVIATAAVDEAVVKHATDASINKNLAKQEPQSLPPQQPSVLTAVISRQRIASRDQSNAHSQSDESCISGSETAASNHQANSSLRRLAGSIHSYIHQAGSKLETSSAAEYRIYTQDEACGADSQPPCTSSASAPDLGSNHMVGRSVGSCSSYAVGWPAGSRNNYMVERSADNCSKNPTRTDNSDSSRGNTGILADRAVRVPSAASSVWEAFVSSIRSATGASLASSGGMVGNKHSSHDSQPQSDKAGTASAPHNAHQRRSTDKDLAQDPSIIAECFKITSAAAPGDEGLGPQSITMIKYTALKQQIAQEGASEVLPLARRLVASTISTTTSTVGASASLQSTLQAQHWAQVCVDICVHQVGGFRMKGIDKVADVVQVMPTSLAGRVQWLLPSNTTRGKCQCVAPALGLVADCKAYLPDLSQLISWITAAALAQQAEWISSQETVQPVFKMPSEQAGTGCRLRVQHGTSQEGGHSGTSDFTSSPLPSTTVKSTAALGDLDDPDDCGPALQEAAVLREQYCGGTNASNTNNASQGTKMSTQQVNCSADHSCESVPRLIAICSSKQPTACHKASDWCPSMAPIYLQDNLMPERSAGYLDDQGPSSLSSRRGSTASTPLFQGVAIVVDATYADGASSVLQAPGSATLLYDEAGASAPSQQL